MTVRYLNNLRFLSAMTLAVGAASGAPTLISCNKKESSRSTLSTPDSGMLQDQTYRRSCIADPGCLGAERIAATYDYVGAVYSQTGKYDGFLKAPERDAVQNAFGAIFTPERIPQFLGLAHRQTLKPFLTNVSNPVCAESYVWKLLQAKDPRLGEAIALGGAHHCFDQFSFYFTNSGMEQEIASSPEKWIFFIERGSGAERAQREGKANPEDEIALFHHIAKSLGIPLENPLEPVDGEAVIRELEKQGLPRLRQASTLIIGFAHDAMVSLLKEKGRFDGLDVEGQKVLIHRYINRALMDREIQDSIMMENIIQTFGINKEDLLKFCLEQLKVQQGESYSSWHDKLKFRADFQKAISLSNQLSGDRIRSLLSKHNRRKAFFQMGSLHLPLITSLYQEVRDIPNSDVPP